mmetsp:Transcript_53388/g.134074  ORF Transcript_53388/g.134074 Transcript_53388/m.134074 type:complete len:341 (+) Transcript_53388:55-1077(+)|eukprot:CAMPEP_0177647190 /NCGR_PEP_ID=MMETSP0447-20121125/10170_1 /TAXON_ID=0 /ORGANISM="Stygamoeba regulata, Strain BSH-02190019" /LENGTH=340 /DNA_ID=CAMNT_0019149763 /DNA_START=54 /DNA_END=1076 /DNA_ORIENTATION=-
MLLFFLAFVLSLSVKGAQAQGDLPPNYQSLSATEKQNALWQLLSADSTPEPWPSAFDAFQLTKWNLSLAFTVESDYRPYKPRVVHVEGAVAKFKFVPTASRYTGVFAAGGVGVLRLSTASAPSTGGLLSGSSIIPAVALKFLVDGQPSLNVALMYKMTGHSGINVFERPLCNHVPLNDLTLPLKVLQYFFDKVSPYASCTGLGRLAATHPTGSAEAHPVLPFALIVQPNPFFTRALADNEDADVMKAVSRIQAAGKALYRVYGVSGPNFPASDTLDLLGEVVLGSALTTSAWGDRHLFFQQQLLDDDLAAEPAWAAAVAEGGFFTNEGLPDKYEAHLPPW